MLGGKDLLCRKQFNPVLNDCPRIMVTRVSKAVEYVGAIQLQTLSF